MKIAATLAMLCALAGCTQLRCPAPPDPLIVVPEYESRPASPRVVRVPVPAAADPWRGR